MATGSELTTTTMNAANEAALLARGAGVVAQTPANAKPDDRITTAVNALSIMTGESTDAVRGAILNPDTKIVDVDRLRQYMDNNKDKITAAQTPEALEALSQEQRDVMRKFLQEMGYAIDPKSYEGKTPAEQSAALGGGFQAAQADLGMDPAQMFSTLIIGMIADALGLENQFAELLGSIGGKDTYGLRGGGVGSSRSGPAKFATELEIEAIVAGVSGKGTMAGVVNLAIALDGQAEEGNNRGAIVRATMGYEGEDAYWCGGLTRFAFDKAGLAGIYDQGDYTSARSFMREGQEHGAFREKGSGYSAKLGDVIVFSSNRGAESGHVGIVVAVDGDNVTYMSGNDGDQVQPRTISLSNPPGRLLGFTDTAALAAAKGIEIQQAPEMVVAQASVQKSTGPMTRDY